MSSIPSLRSSRRSFFAAGGLGALSTLLPLTARPQNLDGFKALVCVFLNGGNDSNNMIVPLGSSYSDYYLKARPIIAVDDSSVSPLAIANQSDPTVNPTGEPWGFHPALTPAGGGLGALFDQGKLAVVGNVGTLVEPVTRPQVEARSKALPIQLGSHRDQSIQWQSSISDRPFTSGWGGRLAELIYPDPGKRGNISVSTGRNYLLRPDNNALDPLNLASGTPLRIGLNPTESDILSVLYDVSYSNTTSQVSGNLFAENHRQQVNTAQAYSAVFSDALSQFVEPAGWPDFGTSRLGQQLANAARIIAVHGPLGQQRQILYTSFGGFDTHSYQNNNQNGLFSELTTGLSNFNQAMEALGLSDQVTAFTASDFNRTWTNNRDTAAAGTDHAWGGHALVMGGAVQGGRLYGRMPLLDMTGPDFTTRAGRASWIPSASVDEYSATLAKWFGMDNAQLAQIFPNLSRFDSPDLGFMA